MTDDIPDDVYEQVEALADESGIDTEEALDIFNEAVEEVQEYGDGDFEDDKVYEIALRASKADIISATSYGQEVTGYAFGHNGIEQNAYRDDDENMVDEDGNPTDDWSEAAKYDVLKAYAVVTPEGEPEGVAEVKFDGRETDLDHAAMLLQCGTAFAGRFSVMSNDDMDNHYRCYATENVNLRELDEDEVDVDVTEKLNKHSEEATIADIANHLSARRRYSGNVYYVKSDIKRVEGYVVDAYRRSEDGFAVCTIQDDTLVDESEFAASDVGGDDDRTPGLTCWANEYNMDFGEGTQGTFYGRVERDDEEGRITMQLYGVDAVFARSYSDGDDEEPEESNVDRMSL